MGRGAGRSDWFNPRPASAVEQRMPRLSAPLLCALLASASCGGSSPTLAAPQAQETAAEGCGRTSVGSTPLTDFVGGTYKGQPGGLYAGVRNTPPAAHLAAGIQAARAIGPLDAMGRASAAGRYAFVSIGMSNTTQEFSTFKPLADADPGRDPRLVIVDGAQGGQTAADWANGGCQCWTVLDSRLASAGISAQQVVTAWIKLANRQPTEAFPVHAQRLQQDTVAVVQRLKARFPNLALAYLSSRIYAGYATSTLNPEPYAYESGFAVRGVIDEQLQGRLPVGAAAPWIAWGPYLWSDGLRPRSDGLTWACSDFAADGTHPSTSGRRKVADLLLGFVRTDPTAREWYLANP
jgi:hypothetical protein